MGPEYPCHGRRLLLDPRAQADAAPAPPPPPFLSGQFETGENVVECEVFENEGYGPLSGWGAPSLPGQRLRYSNRKGELSSATFPEVPGRPAVLACLGSGERAISKTFFGASLTARSWVAHRGRPACPRLIKRSKHAFSPFS